MMKTVSRAEITDAQQIPNIGPSIAANLRLIGVLSPNDLLGKDPYKRYDALTVGLSRSPAVAAALSRIYYGDDGPWFELDFPNQMVYDVLSRRTPADR